jgi:hypothetical protein
MIVTYLPSPASGLEGVQLALEMPEGFLAPTAINCLPDTGSAVPITFIRSDVIQEMPSPAAARTAAAARAAREQEP